MHLMTCTSSSHLALCLWTIRFKTINKINNICSFKYAFIKLYPWNWPWAILLAKCITHRVKKKEKKKASKNKTQQNKACWVKNGKTDFRSQLSHGGTVWWVIRLGCGKGWQVFHPLFRLNSLVKESGLVGRCWSRGRCNDSHHYKLVGREICFVGAGGIHICWVLCHWHKHLVDSLRIAQGVIQGDNRVNFGRWQLFKIGCVL